MWPAMCLRHDAADQLESISPLIDFLKHLVWEAVITPLKRKNIVATDSPYSMEPTRLHLHLYLHRGYLLRPHISLTASLLIWNCHLYMEVWCGVIWYSLLWCSLVQCSVVWCSVMLCSVVWVRWHNIVRVLVRSWLQYVYSYQHWQLSQCRRETSCDNYRPQRLVSEILSYHKWEKDPSDKMEKYLYQIHL